MSRSYQYYVEEQKRIWPKIPKSVYDFDYALDKLRYHKLTYEESGSIYMSLSEHVQDEQDIMRLLTASSVNNLFYLALGLFHKIVQVRHATSRLIHRLEMHTVGRHFYDSMNDFQKLAYKRIYQETARELRNRSVISEAPSFTSTTVTL